MAIGTSLGGFFHTEAEMHMSPLSGNDNNVIVPETTPDLDTNDQNEINHVHSPAIDMKVADQMPFPDNRNPDSDFVNRFGNLPPSGILNDLKKPTNLAPALVRRINDAGPDTTELDKPSAHEGKEAGGDAETIKSAAMRITNTGEMFEDTNHGLALGRIMDKYPQMDINLKNLQDGFTTSKGRFVSREEAFGIARQQDQIKDEVLPVLDENSTMLLSEDLK